MLGRLADSSALPAPEKKYYKGRNRSGPMKAQDKAVIRGEFPASALGDAIKPADKPGGCCPRKGTGFRS